jgi:hypothetical protein
VSNDRRPVVDTLAAPARLAPLLLAACASAAAAAAASGQEVWLPRVERPRLRARPSDPTPVFVNVMTNKVSNINAVEGVGLRVALPLPLPLPSPPPPPSPSPSPPHARPAPRARVRRTASRSSNTNAAPLA